MSSATEKDCPDIERIRKIEEGSRPCDVDPLGKFDFESSEDKKLLKKIDLHLLPILTFIYLLSFLDRSNIGNAKLDGLTEDLGVSESAYNTSLALYLVGYMSLDVPSNIILKKSNPQLWIPSLALTWGIVSIFQGFVTDQAGLFVIRLLLGLTEAGLFPGCVYLFSVYYRRRERHWRVATLQGATALAGAFGGILAFGIGKMDGIGGKRGWAWIFILEGLITVISALGAYLLVPTWAHTTKFLTETERARLLARLAADSGVAVQESFAWKYVRQALNDPLVWGFCLLFHGTVYALYTLSLFLPTIIAGLGFASWQAQLLTVPPYALATVGIWSNASFSAKTGMRAPYIMASLVTAIVGYIILITAEKAGIQYVGVHLATLGVYSANALILSDMLITYIILLCDSWPSENISGQTKRATAVAMQFTIGIPGAIAGVLIYRPSFSANRYRKPHIIAIGYLTFSMVLATILWAWMHRENRKRDSRRADEQTLPADISKGQAVEMADRNVFYRYQV